MAVVHVLEPQARVCPGRRAPRFAPAGYGFIREVIAAMPSPLSACGVDGYVVDRHGKVTRLFFKREFRVDDPGLSKRQIAEQLIRCEDVQAAKPSLHDLARELGCGVDYLFVPQGYPYEDLSPGAMLLLSVDDPASGRASWRFVDAAMLAGHIRHHRGGRAFSNPKKITVATSCIECYLANDAPRPDGLADPFPGDIDLVVQEQGRVKAIVEFKTHNLGSAISNQSCARYPDEDWRRLDVLLRLVASLQTRLFYVFWGPTHDTVKIEDITVARNILGSTLLKRDAQEVAGFLRDALRSAE